ncbi:MAG: hypothetical protein AB8I08_18225 [Sandaracinaceae bacterium]
MGSVRADACAAPERRRRSPEGDVRSLREQGSDHLRNKRAAGRAKDLADVQALATPQPSSSSWGESE